MAPPIVQTSLFAKETFAELIEALGSEHRNHVYTRGQNPTVEALEMKLAELERAEACKCFSSGMGAVAACLFGLLQQGDHVLFVNHIYGPTLLLARRLGKFGVGHDWVSGSDLETVERHIRPETRLIYFESPSTMMFKTLAIPELVTIAKNRGIQTVIDNTWATPLFQKPIPLGVDLVIHSATKYLAGHSDVVAGALIGSRELLRRIFYNAFLLLGGPLGPMDAWLVHRGLRTLPTRMLQHQRDTLQIAGALRDHPKVRAVHHPALDACRELASGRLSGTSGLFSFELATEDFETLAGFLDRLKLFRLGVSWGGAESLAIAPFRGDNRKGLEAQGIPVGLVRLSVGLEGAEPLIQDLERSLRRLP